MRHSSQRVFGGSHFRILAVPAVLAVLLLAGCGGEGRQGIVVTSGFGIVRAEPDTVQMVISLRYIADTTREAQTQVTGMVRQALEILRSAGVEERNIGTAFLRFSPEYEWGPQGRTLLGQRAEQIISFSIDHDGDDSVFAYVIDQLIGINGIDLQGMNFNVRDTTDLHYQARELAYQEALEKAQQYARLSGKRIVRTVGIFEEGMVPPVARQRLGRTIAQGIAMEDAASVQWAGGTVLPAGEMEVSARVLVEFLMR